MRHHLLILLFALYAPFLAEVSAGYSQTYSDTQRPKKIGRHNTPAYSAAQNGSVADYVKNLKRQRAELATRAANPHAAGSSSTAPTIVESDILNAYAVGSTFRVRDYDGGAEPLSMDVGTVNLASAQSWTVPTFAPQTDEEWRVMDPNDTPYASDFPTATHAAFLNGLCGEDVIDYYTIGNGLVELTGNVETASGERFVDSLFIGLAAFPIGINFNYSENQVFEDGPDRYRYQFTVTSEGYGMLQTAYGTFEVLKVRETGAVYSILEDNTEVLLEEVNGFTFNGKNGYQLYVALAENSPASGVTDIDYLYERAPNGAADPSQPSITCPPDVSVNVPNGQCSAVVNFNDPTFSDDDPDPFLEQTCGEESGAELSVGTHIVEWTVTDVTGLSAICQMKVRVKDAQLPSISCPGNLSLNTEPNQCTKTVSFASPSFSDNCAGAKLVQTGGLSSGSAFPKGMNLVSWKVTDASGNTAGCQTSVEITDAQPPSISCPANLVRNTDLGQCGATVSYSVPTFSDNCAGAFVEREGGGASGSFFPKGTNTVRWKVVDGAGLSVTCAFAVTVNDGQPPSISCPANVVRSTDVGTCAARVAYSVSFSDNCSGGNASLVSGLPSGSAFPKGLTTVLWRATDAAGLTHTCSFRVTVHDGQLPSVSCPASIMASTDPNQCSAVATYANAIFSDNCPGGMVTRISGLPSGSAFPLGVSAVVFRAIDAAGLSKTCSFSVIVTDNQQPNIVCPTNISVEVPSPPNGLCSAVATYVPPTASDNCSVQSVSLVSGLGSGSNFPQGTTTNVWRAADNSGRTSTCAFTVTVNCGASGGPSQPLQMGGAAIPHAEASSPLSTGEGLEMRLSPNPTATEVQVHMENLGEQGGHLMLLDVQGRVMWQSPGAAFESPFSLNVSNLPPGVYQLRLLTERGTATQALMIER